MFKKALALLLAVSALLTLCSCSLVDMFKPADEETTETTMPETTTELNTDWYTETWTELSTTEPADGVPVVQPYRGGTGSNTNRQSGVQTTKKPVGTQITCDHVFADATCSKPRTCVKCGLEKGKPNKHNFAAATCTKPETCRNCGLTNGAPLGHDYDALGRCKRCDPYYTSQKKTTATTAPATDPVTEKTTDVPKTTDAPKTTDPLVPENDPYNPGADKVPTTDKAQVTDKSQVTDAQVTDAQVTDKPQETDKPTDPLVFG